MTNHDKIVHVREIQIELQTKSSSLDLLRTPPSLKVGRF